jgi:DNA modification methylase
MKREREVELMRDYENREYLSSIEAAKYLGISVEKLNKYVKEKTLKPKVSASGQKRYNLSSLLKIQTDKLADKIRPEVKNFETENIIKINNTEHKVFIRSASNMYHLKDNSVHLIVTSPPYFNAKMYSGNKIDGELGNIHNLETWLEEIGKVWEECFRVLAPGRKMFVNIMNLPVRLDGGGYRTLNLVGKTIDLMEEKGFIFKRDIVWEKTNGVKAHFGTYPYPGGILLNNMHEFILEFNKPEKKNIKKYSHVSVKDKEFSKLDKDFWLSIKNSDVWVMNPEKSGGSRKHVAPYPFELPYRIIKAYSYSNETVLDPFLGSGTTMRAAAELLRHSVGYEIVPEIALDTIGEARMKRE